MIQCELIKLYNDDDIVYNRDIHGDSLGIFCGICQTFHHENGGPLENGAFEYGNHLKVKSREGYVF